MRHRVELARKELAKALRKPRLHLAAKKFKVSAHTNSRRIARFGLREEADQFRALYRVTSGRMTLARDYRFVRRRGLPVPERRWRQAGAEVFGAA